MARRPLACSSDDLDLRPFLRKKYRKLEENVEKGEQTDESVLSFLERIFPSPPSTPPFLCDSLEGLPDHLLIKIIADSCILVLERFHLRTVSKRMDHLVKKSWPKVKKIRLANVESQDERICPNMVLRVLSMATNVQSVTLCLSSSINSTLCNTNDLFIVLSQCPNLRELTLFLTQLNINTLNAGLDLLGRGYPFRVNSCKLRKLCLVNSCINIDTAHKIAFLFGDLRSLGLINCHSIDDDALWVILEGCTHLQTLNVRYTKGVTSNSIQQLIDQSRIDRSLPYTPVTFGQEFEKFRKDPPLKLYLKYSGVEIGDLDGIGENWIKTDLDFDMKMEHLNLKDDSPRSSWEYDSETDFDCGVEA